MKKKNKNRQRFVYFNEKDFKYIDKLSKEELIEKYKEAHINIINQWMQHCEELMNDIEQMIEITERFKMALFITIRNNVIMPQGIELGKTEKEINKMALETMKELFGMIDFKSVAKKMKEAEEDE